MAKKQPPQDQQHQCHPGPDQELTNVAEAAVKDLEADATDKAKEPTYEELAAAADESEAADKVIAVEGNDLLERLQEISRLQYRAIMGFHVHRISMSRICVELRITPDRLQIEIAAGFKTLFHLAIEDDFMGYFTRQAKQYAKQLAEVEAKEGKKKSAELKHKQPAKK